MNTITKVSNMMKTFGLRNGMYMLSVWILKQLHIYANKETKVKWVEVKPIQTKVYIRPGTTDYDLLLEFFFQRGEPLHYDIDFLKLLNGKPPKYILDAGSNIGLFSLKCEAKYHPEKILTVEPEQSNYKLLTLNTKSKSNIVCINAGLWINTAFLKVVPSPAGKWGFTVEECSEQDADTRGTSISDLMERQGIPYFDIIKMDIEGSEYYIFKDDLCEHWLKKTKVVVIETHDRKVNGSTEAVFSRMTKLGFQYFQQSEDYVFYKPEYIKERTSFTGGSPK